MRKVVEPKFPIRQTGAADYVRRMVAGEPWTLSRFNDGEWFAVLGRDDPKYHTYRNCDGHQYHAGLCDDLAECMLHPLGYTYGIGGMKHHDAQYSWLSRNHVDIDWHYSDSFKLMNRNGQLKLFLDQLRTMNVLIVGPRHLHGLGKILRLPNAGFIRISHTNCYLETIDAIDNIERAVEYGGYDFVSFSASMATNVWIHRLWPEFGKRVWMLDAGAMWDIYVGVESRGVYRNEDWAPIVAKNLA